MTEKEVCELLERKQYKVIKESFADINEVDLAELLERLPEKQMIMAFRLIGKEEGAETFSLMEPKQQQILVEALTERELKAVLDEMFLDDTADLLEEMPANVVERILANTDLDTRRQLNQLLSYPEDSVGSIMTVEYVDLKPEMTVRDSLEKIRRVGIDSETIYTCYVIRNKKLLGIVTAKALLISDERKTVEEIMESNIISINTHDDQEAAAKLVRKYGLLALPVVDKEGCMVGIVTVDDAMEVMQDETTEDIALMAAIAPSEDSYFGTSVFRHARNRIVWLLILMLSATFTGIIITKYENAFAAIPLLVSFIPMLMDTSGNCGSQSATLIIRGMAIDEIHLKDVARVVWKEMRVAVLVSTTLAVVNGIRIFVMYGDVRMAVLIGLTLVCTITLAELIGCTLPMLAKKCRLDPAIMAAPLITTCVDAAAILIYFSIATSLFKL
ncbi:magnesium transporter [Lacrimispora sp. NSJ-141]|uniref:Magnesium transporter MgtE n=1 Tax=Lientehia hominis TaxID=2897778 RepID=A0AAP2W9K1_9FIRM|nr:magnesium transporter [Lientehia hominis]MCD2493376.1 magnesium transporter [Lientehia hominis]